MEKAYDLAVIGGGPAGYEAAIRASQLGLSTALIENREVGGTCLNRGCIPTKSILHSSGLYREAKRFGEIGLSADGLSFDFSAVMQRKNAVVAELRGGIEQLLHANAVDLYRGKGTLQKAGVIAVTDESGSQEIHTARILLAVGCVPAVPPIPGADLPGVVTSDGLLELNAFPRRLVIVGGGVIGAEFATAFSDLGCEVTVIEAMQRILPTMDREISQSLSMILKKRGVQIHTSSLVEKITEGAPLSCTFTEKGTERSVEADCILISVGRKPNITGLFAEGLDIKMEKGFLATNGHHETSLPGVFAVGDVAGGIQLAHAASAQGIEAVEFMAQGEEPVRSRAVPACVYTSPEIACAGLTADEAKQQGLEVTVGKALTAALGKSLIEREERGFVKLVFEKQSGMLLGAQLMCGRATDLIAGLTQAIDQRLTARELVSVIRPHPTFSEAVTEAAEDALGGAIHAVPRAKR
ncbi:dihydrolipoyl dehydrogenase [Caproiciproducens sp. NJN-50]|uniref:dihydrolipoyl dehydrogenase n=1 Tax=Acutalibacteraceae TaxID=3082771 RepID=UPI000FFE2113|nr:MULTISPECIES: dihydrolipoyl dehydrogenase [Acutalibacteraceae]QAT49161.1 dihydrolipoyl dehydrogenase [Caproiciproducens sp. NJN-50]